MNRRLFILAATTALAACGSTATPPNPNTIADDVRLISAGLQGVMAAAMAVGVPATVATQAQNILSAIYSNADLLASAVVVDPRRVQDLVALVGQLANVMQPYYDRSATIAGLITAALTLGDVILNKVGKTSLAARPTGMTPDQARTILRGR